MIHTVDSKSNKYLSEAVVKKSKMNGNQTLDSIPNTISNEDYFTLEEFRKIAIEKGHSFCDKHGII